MAASSLSFILRRKGLGVLSTTKIAAGGGEIRSSSFSRWSYSTTAVIAPTVSTGDENNDSIRGYNLKQQLHPEVKWFLPSYSTAAATVVAPATTENEKWEISFRNLDKFRRKRVYTKNTRVLVINEDNLELSVWLKKKFTGEGKVWSATAGPPDNNMLKKISRGYNLRELQSPPPAPAPEKKKKKIKKKKEEKMKKKKNKKDRKNEKLGKKKKKTKEELEEEKRKEEEEKKRKEEEEEEKKRKEKEEKKKKNGEKEEKQTVSTDVFWDCSVKKMIADTYLFKNQGFLFDRVVLKLAHGQCWEEVSDLFLAAQDSLIPGGEFHIFTRRSGGHNGWDHRDLARSYPIDVEKIHFSYGRRKHKYTLYRYYDKALLKKMIQEEKEKKEKEEEEKYKPKK